MVVRRACRISLSAVLAAALVGTAASATAAPPKYRLIRVPLPGVQGLTDSLGLELTESGDAMMRFYNGLRPTTQTTYLYKDGALINFAPDMTQALGVGMNERGDIVGQFVDDEGVGAFVYIDGVFSKLPAGVFVPLEASLVNDAGLVVGPGSFPPDGLFRSFFWKEGAISLLPLGSFTTIFAADLNNAGDVAGSGTTTAGESHVFLHRDGETVDLGTLPGYSSITSTVMSETGIIAGFGFLTGNTSHAFRYSNGALVDLGNLGGELVDVYDVNKVGHIVGVSERANGDRRAFLDDGRAMVDLGTLGGSSSEGASDITDNGQICGSATNADGSARAFIYGVGSKEMLDLNSLIADSDPLKPFVTLHDAVRVNEYGQILAQGKRQGFRNERTYIASPIDSTKPVIKSKLAGDRGTNGWFTSNVVLTWNVTDAQAPIARKEGCGEKSVSADTGGRKFSCRAVSIGGAATRSVTIKRDTHAPTATIRTPANGAIYSRNQVVLAAYNCADALSGIRRCDAPVANGAAIDTSVRVTNKRFTVKATDGAGLMKTVTRTYSVR
jgi:probable HAF family extracellular repeat protein